MSDWEIITIKNIENYIYHLGLFWQNFNNLEYFLRLYLNKKNGKDSIYALKMINLSEGDICDENDITDWKSFSDLCKEFNNYQEINDKIDFNDLINLRDALAHWRVTSDNIGIMKVIKYSKPKNHIVKVEYKKELKIEDIKNIVKDMTEITMTISLRGGATIK